MSFARPPRSVRNHNPGNIERNSIPWLGLAESSEMTAEQRAEQRFCVFKTDVYGFRALAIDLNTKFRRGLVSVNLIIRKFAPPKNDAGVKENDTDAYVRAVCDALGVEPDKALDLGDPITLQGFCRAIATHEAGAWLFQTNDLVQGVSMALNQSRKPAAIA